MQNNLDLVQCLKHYAQHLLSLPSGYTDRSTRNLREDLVMKTTVELQSYADRERAANLKSLYSMLGATYNSISSSC